VCVCYHPPKSRYSPIELVSVLHDNLEELLVVYPHDIFVITGDLNQLRYHSLLVDFGLSQIVTEPTRNSNILDVFLTSRPDLFDCRVAKSVLKSDHLLFISTVIRAAGGILALRDRLNATIHLQQTYPDSISFLVITIGMQLLAELIMELCLLTRRLLIL